MDSKTKKLIERYENDFDKLSANENYTPEQLTRMKDLQKLMYYMEIRCAMKEGQDYPGSNFMPNSEERSYARHRDSMGRFASGHYPMMDNGNWYYDNMGSGRNYYDGYDGGNTSGRRYYDSEKEKAIHYLHKRIDSESRPDVISDIQTVIRELEMK